MRDEEGKREAKRRGIRIDLLSCVLELERKKEESHYDLYAVKINKPLRRRRGSTRGRYTEKIVEWAKVCHSKFACSEEMIRCRSEVEEAVRMISSTYSSKISKDMKRRLRDRGEGGNMKLYLRLAFTVLTLERVTIGCCEVGGGGGDGVIGGVGVVCGDGVDSGVGGVVCGFVYGVVSGGQGTDFHDDCKGTRER
nr:hypothetical protein [Tanacetum cinerariifolium]GEY97909.1 hypothetical protein [Tanacetum cinerariifolium]